MSGKFAVNRNEDDARRQWSLTELPELLTARELEAILKIDQKTLYGYVQRGLIPYVRIQSNIRFPKRQIAEWIEQQSYRLRPNSRNDAEGR